MVSCDSVGEWIYFVLNILCLHVCDYNCTWWFYEHWVTEVYLLPRIYIAFLIEGNVIIANRHRKGSKPVEDLHVKANEYDWLRNLRVDS